MTRRIYSAKRSVPRQRLSARAKSSFLIALTLACGFLAAATGAFADAGGKQASFVIDANTGAVISAFNADEPRHPASLTKMMTLYIVFEKIERGQLTMTTPITITEHAAAAQPTKLNLPPGSQIALLDGIKALVTHSANDVAIAIAEHISGSEERFATLMTQKAHALGMTRTTFKNASGLPNSEQFTTARDMVTLGLRLHDQFPEHFKLFALHDFRYNGHTYANHNTMLDHFEGTEGIKTGYTAASGFNLVSSVKRGTKHVMGAVFGGSSASSRNLTMRTLLNIALFKASPVRTRPQAVAELRKVPDPKPAVRPAAASFVPVAATAAPAAPTTGDSVTMARVRPVLVAPGPSLRRTVSAAANVKVAEAPGAAPVRFAAAGAAGLAPSDDARMAPREFAPATAVSPSPARGAPPSTLGRQAMALGQQAPAPGATTASASKGGMDIQIGAYSSAAEAERHLQEARAKAADLIGGTRAVTLPVTANGKALWRARFSGVDASAAGSLCTELRRRQIDCFVAPSQ